MDVEKLDLNASRSEEVSDIIDRMPTKFGYFITLILISIFILFFSFGMLIRYPDVIRGQITLNSDSSPLKLVANTSGQLKLYTIHQKEVHSGDIIGYIKNSTDPNNVIYIDSVLRKYQPNDDNYNKLLAVIPKNIFLGELNAYYYEFSNNLQDFANHKNDKLYEKQSLSMSLLLSEQTKALISARQRVNVANSALKYSSKFYSRDSVLFLKKVISESELDKTQINYLSSKDAFQNALNNLSNLKQSVQQTEAKIQELKIQKPEKESELRIALASSYSKLLDQIKDWEQKYIFKAPFPGTIQLLKFYKNEQFVQTGESIFAIVPKHEKIFGQVILPAQGSGKVKIGQEVIVKLDNFPFQEYGSLKGNVRSISLTTNTAKTENSEIDTYLVIVDFPEQLKTNYGSDIDFKTESKGSAEIVTNDRVFLFRLFDNLKYMIKR